MVKAYRQAPQELQALAVGAFVADEPPNMESLSVPVAGFSTLKMKGMIVSSAKLGTKPE